MERIDKLLVKLGKVRSRTQAQVLIESGAVTVDMQGVHILVKKNTEKFANDVQIQIAEDMLPKYVSRAGEKLAHAFHHYAALSNAEPTQLIADAVVLDIGQSTGGFTDFVLQHQAQKVLGVEVGTEQLVPSLVENPRVTTWEGVNARHLPVDRCLEYAPKGFDFVLMDVSFISQTLIHPHLNRVLSDTGLLISLVKPQFEVGPDGIGKSGIVKDSSLFNKVKAKIESSLQHRSFKVLAYFESYPPGTDGNTEFFVIACRRDSNEKKAC